MSDEYPRDSELRMLAKWDFEKRSVHKFLSEIERLWHWPDWGFNLKGKNVLRLSLHTGGWSGNESIIGAIEKNFIFWATCWQETRVGGHYKFTIKLKLFGTPKEKP